MPGVREVLQFVLEADSSGAVKGFEAVAKASDKHLGDSEKSASNLGSTMTKVGAVAAGAGIAIAAGLVGTVRTFEKAEESAAKLDTAVSGMGSHIDTKQIKDLAFQLQQVSTATDNQIVSAARWGAVYGLSTNQLKTLLRAAVDLSAQTGQSIDATTKALARAASGGSDKVLVKWGLQLDETARKADAFGTTVSASMDFAGGAAAKSANTMSGQMERMAHNWTDVKEKIGAGANEVFEPLARGAANLSEKVADLNPALLATVGHVSALGSMGLTAFGGLASLGGQLVNLREGFSGIGGVAEKAFSKIGVPLKDAEGNSTKFASGLGKVAGGLGALAGGTVALYEVANAIDQATQNAVGLDTALKRAGSADSPRQLANALRDAGEAGSGFFESIQHAVSGDITYKIAGVEISSRKLGTALHELENKDPATALAALDLALASLKKQLDATTDPHRRVIMEGDIKGLEANRKELAANVKASKEAADATGDLTKKTEPLEDVLKASTGAMGLYAIAANESAVASKGFATAAEGLDTDEQVTSALKLGDAFHGVQDSVKDLPHSFDETTAAMGGYNEGQTKAITAVTDWGDAAKAQISTLIESGATNEQVAAKAGTYRDALTGVMKQAGLTDDQIHAYLQTLGLTPEQVATELKLSGDEKAKFQLQLYHNDLVGLTADQDTYIRALIAQGEYATAVKALDQFKHPIDATINVHAVMDAAAKAVGAPFGGWMGVGRSAPAPAGVSAGVHAATPIPVAVSAPNITITLPAGTTPATTLAAIRRYQRLGGDMGGLLDTVAAIR